MFNSRYIMFWCPKKNKYITFEYEKLDQDHNKTAFNGYSGEKYLSK